MSVILDIPKNTEVFQRKIEVIPPRKKFTVQKDEAVVKKRVAAYCRVSTDSDEQELSFETQCQYYRNYINEHPNYILVDVYADEGISGTSLSRREAFNQMMADAKDGKIDMIITKSITRFARNTVDSLNSLRTLKEYGVEVYFEMENINSLEGSEMLITILSSLAQESSQEKSDSVKWGYQRQFEKGKVYASNLFGYKSNRGELVIVEEEAKSVREIFAMYLQGFSINDIKHNLKERGIKTRRGSTEWSISTLRGMLSNEKYTGNSKNGKIYNIDFLHPKRLQNNGQAPMFLVENSHPAIVSKEIFEQVQIERARRLKNKKEVDQQVSKSNRGRYTSVNSLANKIICANCGDLYRRAVWTKRSGEKQPVWRCANRLDNGKHACNKSITLKEKEMFDQLVIIINNVLSRKNTVLNDIANEASKFVNPRDIQTKKESLNRQLEEVNQDISQSLDEGMLLISRGVQDENGLKEHLEQHYNKKRKLLKEIEELDDKLESIREVKKSKVLNAISKMTYPVSNLSQEEISVFIKEIIVGSQTLQVITTTGESFEIEQSKVN